MSAIVKAKVQQTGSHVFPVGNPGKGVHTVHIAPEPQSPSAHNAPIQRSLPLFQVVRPEPVRNTAPHCANASLHTHSHPAQVIEQATGLLPQQGLFATAMPAGPRSSRRHLWSAASVDVLRSDYPTAKLVLDISAELGRSVGAVYGKARRLGLRRPCRGAAPADAAVLLPAPAPEALQPSASPAPEPSPPHVRLASLSPKPAPTPQPSPARKVELTKLGGRAGRWTKNDGALSERLERLFIGGFTTPCIAAVLDVTDAAVRTRAWVVNCPRRDLKLLRHDVEAARLVDRLAAPLPLSIPSWTDGKMLVRKPCKRKGNFFWGTSGIHFSNDAKRQHGYRDLRASESMHAY